MHETRNNYKCAILTFTTENRKKLIKKFSLTSSAPATTEKGREYMSAMRHEERDKHVSTYAIKWMNMKKSSLFF
jgi:hypothetical protein